MACADFCRAEDSRFNRVTHFSKVSPDGLETEGDVAKYVFSEENRGGALAEDAPDMRPEVAGVLIAEAFSGLAERLARVPGREDTHLSAPRAAVKGDKVRPDRRVIQGLFVHPGHESGRSVCVSLDPANSSIFRYGERQTEFEPSRSCGKGDSCTMFGM